MILTSLADSGRFIVMTSMRWPSAFVASVFALFLTVVGGFAPTGPDASGLASAAVESDAPEWRLVEQHLGPSAEGAECKDASSCRMPRMPGGCPPASPCPSAVTVPAAPVSWDIAKPRPGHVAVGDIGVPFTREFPPELPPPRS